MHNVHLILRTESAEMKANQLVLTVLFLLPVVSSSAQPLSLSPSPTQASQIKSEQSPSLDLSGLENSVRPAVIWVTVFDSSGKLLRTQTGFLNFSGFSCLTVRSPFD
jgi:hypothetical protein